MSEKNGLPKGWQWKKLSDIAEVIAGQSPPGSTYRKQPDGLPFFQGKADFGARHPVPTMWCVAPKKIAQSGDILISVRAPVGPTNVADVECCIGRGLSAIRVEQPTERDFILAFLKFNEKKLAETGSGSTFAAITQNDLKFLKIPLPPPSEQKRIVAILNEKLTAVEEARNAATTQLEAARALPAAYLREVFDGEEAKKWKKKQLAEILIQRREIIHPKDHPKGPAIFVGLEHIESGTGKRIGSLDVEMSELTGRKPKFCKNDIVYGYLRPYLNKVWIAEFDGLCSVDQYVYSVEESLADTEFVAWFMRSATYLKRAPIGLTPGQLPRIRTEEVATVEINLPFPETQKAIAKEINDKLKTSMDAIAILEKRLSEIEKVPAALLRQAFNGEL